MSRRQDEHTRHERAQDERRRDERRRDERGGEPRAVTSDPLDLEGSDLRFACATQRTGGDRVADSAAPDPWPLLGQLEQSLAGTSDSIRAVRARIAAAARTPSTVLISGETGTGKGVVARALHALSPRGREPFVHMNCASLAPGTVESELFGHERGAFTGAVERRRGRLELAGRGTLFLDEMGELDPVLQAKFLRVLQERTFERVGGNQTYSLRARIVAATHRDLRADVRQGRFRADLYYRLNVLRIHVPPLRERIEDVGPLARDACERMSRELGRPVPRLSPRFSSCLAEHRWPGNVRELMNVLERCLTRSDSSEFGEEDLLEALQELTPLEQAPEASTADAMGSRTDASHIGAPHADDDAAEQRDRIVRMLRETGGNVSRAARRLGISRSTLRYRIARHRLFDHIPRD